MRVAVVCYALVLRSAALRDEISRFEPLELEVPDEKMHQEAPMNFLTSGETSTVRNADQPEAFLEVISATNCIDGTLHLRGQNVVNSALVFSKECATLRGDMGAQVTLKEPLIFEGDLRMEGDIRFIAARSFWQPCVSVKGNASMFGNIHFEGCRNKDTKLNAGGGGLMVGKTLTQHAGAIAFHNCSSEDRGGGLYVNESIAQNNGTMVFSNCSSKRNGGGLYVDKSMVQNNGTMEFRSCSTESHGGGLYVEKSMVQNNGTIAFSNCSSRLFNGGGLYVDKSMVQNNGTMEFSSCSSESYGGGLYVGESMQNNGTMAFRNCISREKGGGLYVYRGMQNNGMMAFSNCSAEGGGLYELDGAGGGLFVFGSMQNNGTMEFSNCSSELKGGGIHVSENVTQNGGVMEFSNCRSQGDGGGFHTYGATTQNNGQMKFHTCYSALSGGGFYGSNGLIQNSGEMEFTNCSSTGDGGGFYVDSEMMQNGGNLEFHDCRSQGNGGGLFANVMMQNGTMEFQNCSSQVNGGGLYVSEMMQNGAIEFKKCSSKKNGGGVFSISVLTQNGRMDFSNCSSGQGGGLYSSELQSNGLLRFSHCSATRKGGGLYSSKLQSNGLLRFSHCSATGRGGGLHVSTVTQNNGSLGFSNCNSQWNGGCFYSSSFTQKNGGVGFSNCSSQRSGGGLYVASEYDFQHGTAFFHHCSAKEDGGGLWVSRFQQQAPVSFYNCRAAIGEGLSAIRINGTQPMNFHECRATEAGGALRLQGLEGSAVDRFRAENCSATRASAIQARNLTIKSLVLVDTVNQTVDAVSLKVSTTSFHASEGTKPDLSMEAVDLQIDSDVDCSKLRECRLVVTSSAPKLGGFQCSLGAGVAEHPAFGCLACPEGYTQIENVTNGSCRQCPKGASFCHAAKIQMMHGFMLDERNVSRPLHCPTKAACHGGELPVNEGRPMCQKGYGGEGCASCVRDEGTLPALYLMPDSSVLACTPCAPDTASQLLQWCSFLGQRIVLFAVSAASIFAAGQADRVKNSGVYLNQLMAFAAVSGCVVTAVMQTETAQTMKNAAVESLYGTAVFLSEAGSGQGFYSSHCLLSYLGLESTGVFGVHCLDVVVATSLVLLLSFKDFRVALVAGLNCFLPSILADFAKYAVCYSLEEDQTGGMEDLICKHLPLPFGNLLGFLAVVAGFLTVFAVSLLVWILLSTSVKEDKLHELPHVAFLTNKYGEGRRYFEAERLVRKVLLATAAAFYPSTTFPALQMTGLTVITCASMCFYGIFHPYRQQIWNWSELGLLATAQLLIAMASAVISNEEQWDKTEIGQMSMIVTLGAIVTAVCSVFMVKIAMEVWHERRPADGSSHPE